MKHIKQKIEARLELAGWPNDFFSLLVKEHKEFTNSTSVRVRGFYQGQHDKCKVTKVIKTIKGKPTDLFDIFLTTERTKEALLHAEDERDIILNRVLKTCKKHKLHYAKTPLEFSQHTAVGLPGVNVSPVLNAGDGIHIFILCNVDHGLLNNIIK